MRESEKEMPKTVREVAAIADFRNAEPVGSIKGLERLEKQFREGGERTSTADGAARAVQIPDRKRLPVAERRRS